MWHCYSEYPFSFVAGGSSSLTDADIAETGYCQMFSFGIMEASAGLGAYYLCAR